MGTGVVVALITTIWMLVRGRLQLSQTRIAIVLGYFFIALVSGLLIHLMYYWNSTLHTRLILPSAASIVAGLVFGLTALPRRGWIAIVSVIPGLMLTLSLVTYISVVNPSTWLPAPPASIPNRLDYRFEDVIELLGTSVSEIQAHPGEAVAFEVYWRALRPDSRDLQFYLASSAGMYHQYPPAGGELTSSQWQVGKEWVEIWRFVVPLEVKPSTRILLLIGVVDPAHTQNLNVVNAEGIPLQPKAITIQVIP
jgi:hypothetical protein